MHNTRTKSEAIKNYRRTSNIFKTPVPVVNSERDRSGISKMERKQKKSTREIYENFFWKVIIFSLLHSVFLEVISTASRARLRTVRTDANGTRSRASFYLPRWLVIIVFPPIFLGNAMRTEDVAGGRWHVFARGARAATVYTRLSIMIRVRHRGRDWRSEDNARGASYFAEDSRSTVRLALPPAVLQPSTLSCHGAYRRVVRASSLSCERGCSEGETNVWNERRATGHTSLRSVSLKPNFFFFRQIKTLRKENKHRR